MRAKARGFSFVELMVVLTVAGILLAIGVPSFNSQIKNSRLTSSVNDVVASMHLSRSEASKRGVPVVMCTSTTANSAGNETCNPGVNWYDGWIVFADTDANGTFDDNVDQIISRQDAQKKGLCIDSNTEIQNTITYLPNGFADLPLNTVSGRYIVYCDEAKEDRYSRVLSFSNSGRPSVVSREVATSAPSCTGVSLCNTE